MCFSMIFLNPETDKERSMSIIVFTDIHYINKYRVVVIWKSPPYVVPPPTCCYKVGSTHWYRMSRYAAALQIPPWKIKRLKPVPGSQCPKVNSIKPWSVKIRMRKRKCLAVKKCKSIFLYYLYNCCPPAHLCSYLISLSCVSITMHTIMQ